MAKFYTAKKEIGGKTYVCQFNGISAALDAVDNSYIEGTNNTSVLKLAKYLFESEVMQGNFREKKDESTTKTKNKE